ncbi:hypothetical protein OIV83_002658 [Microbotryomycetes sp. JL201]|nr:hypothetical protein OIV83_002658 [Microbotryomycetes sp. JL201]
MPSAHGQQQPEEPKPSIAIVVPAFELSRSKRLPLAMSEDELAAITWLTYEEDDDPFGILARHLKKSFSHQDMSCRGIRVHVEENVRQFVASGVRQALHTMDPSAAVELASLTIRQQRMSKTKAEQAILHCAAKVTIHAIRAVRHMLHIGMTEKEGEKLILGALSAGGLTDLDAIVLFGPNAALPHASASNEKKLEVGEFALFDVGGRLHGYMAKRARQIWTTVSRAQVEALGALSALNATGGSVDRAARDVIETHGFAPYFSHRLGHGIGLQVHEHPYLRGNNEEILIVNETFTIEPGIYIEQGADEYKGIGVRLEDMVLLAEEGWRLLTGEDLAQTPWDL